MTLYTSIFFKYKQNIVIVINIIGYIYHTYYKQHKNNSQPLDINK